MSLYNIKRQTNTIDPGKFIITKFDDDLNVESSYEFHNHHVQGYLCHCPAGQRPTCRHRQMFPMLSLRCDSGWFLDFDTRQWVDPTGAASEASSSKLCLCGQEGCPNEKGDLCDMTSQRAEGPQGSLGSSPALVEGSSEPNPVVALPDHHPFRRRM